MIFLKKEKTSLSYIVFEVSPRCNLNCLYCYNHWKRPSDAAPNEESYQQAKETLKKLFRQANIQNVTFSGGEPMLFNRLEELVLFCRMNHSQVTIITNGQSTEIDRYKRLIKLGVRLFELPLHSIHPIIHDRMTQSNGSWEKSLQSIDTISSLGALVVPVMVITKYNWETVGETIQFIAEKGMNRVMLNRYNIGGNSIEEPNKLLPTKEELNEAFAQANKMAIQHRMQITSNVCTPHCIVSPANYPAIQFTSCSTNMMKRPLTLTAGGDLRFCNHSPNVLGNVNEDRLKTIFEENKLQGNHHTTPEYCASCDVYEQCLGGCKAAAEQIGKTFSDVDPIVYSINSKPKEKQG